ncbi:mitochondrial ribosomal protein L31-domain-containing protein [Xylaria arbuscula]|nr:mitochondrial ribosomal protein L31-domain-containing protein [Xylaria arbuscula]
MVRQDHHRLLTYWHEHQTSGALNYRQLPIRRLLNRTFYLVLLTRRLCVNRKTPWRLSRFQKARQRQRLRAVDAVVATVDQALAKQGETLKALDVWKETMPTESEMLPKDKYTMFDRKEKRYRKGIHKLPKWTRVSQRLNPPGY